MKKVIVPRTSMSRDEAKALAKHALNSRHGDHINFQCELQGFRDHGGMIWRPGFLVWCEVPNCRLDVDLAINDLTLTQDAEQGSIAKMVLVDPASLGAKTGRKSSKFNRQGRGSFRNNIANQ